MHVPRPSLPTTRSLLFAASLVALGGGTAWAQPSSPQPLPLGAVQTFSPVPGSGQVVVFSGVAMGAPQQDARCFPLLADGSLGTPLTHSNPPIISGLTPGAPYTCDFMFVNDGGNAFTGQAVPPVFIPPVAVNPPAVPSRSENVTALRASATAASLSLSFTPPAAPITPISGYAAVCIEAATAMPTRYVVAAGTASPITVSGLLPDHDYSCAVLPYNGSGAGSASLQTFRTAAAPVNVPTLSSWMLGALALLLGSLAAARPRSVARRGRGG